MATTKAKAIEKGDAPAEASPLDDPVIFTADDEHSGWAHDWRNPEAKFAASDHCPNAELRRLAPKQ